MPAPSQPILDNFNRADTGPPPSGSWSFAELIPADSSSSGLKVVANKLAPKDDVSSYAGYWNPAAYQTPAEVYATITAGRELLRLWLCISGQEGAGTANGYYLEYDFSSGTDTLGVYRVTNGVATLLGALINQEVASGDSIGLHHSGTTLEVWYRPVAGAWASLGTRADSTYTSGFLGTSIDRQGNVGSLLALDDFGGGGTPVPPPPEPPALQPGTAPLRVAENVNAIKPPNHGGSLDSDWDEWNVVGQCTIDYDPLRVFAGDRSLKLSKPSVGEAIMRALMYPPPRTYPPPGFLAQEGDVIWFGGAFWLPSGQVHLHTRLIGLSRYNGVDVFSVLSLVLSSDTVRLLCENYPATPSLVYDLTPQAGIVFPRDRWVWVDCGFRIANSNAGQAELWMDGVKIGPRKSGRTLTQPVGYDTAQFGAGTVTGDPVDVWIDRSYIGPVRYGAQHRVRSAGRFAPGAHRLRANGVFAIAEGSAR